MTSEPLSVEEQSRLDELENKDPVELSPEEELEMDDLLRREEESAAE